jgi:mRNA interferase RelE/StbE
MWRIRVGDYRIVYEIQDDRRIVIILVVAHRRESYRGV